MPWALKHFQQSGENHFLTFSCYHRQPKLGIPQVRDAFVSTLARVQQKYELLVFGYVIMPEHVHLLLNEPTRRTFAQMLQSLKQSIARQFALRAPEPFWQGRYYDFNVFSERKFVEKLRYIHRNPVTRGLVARPEDWPWSSFRHYLYGEITPVEIESRWTAQKRESRGLFPTVKLRVTENPRPSGA